MSLLSRPRLAVVFGLSLAVLAAVRSDAGAQAPEKKNVTFRTVDSVDLRGTLWTTPNAKKNACVLLLHNLSRKGGGNRNDDGWDALANDLAKEGYTVLSFDFRGHGDSTTVSKEFWDKSKFPYNQALLRNKVILKVDDYPTKIDYKDFPVTGSYYPHLVDDIAAAKAFLDSKVGGAANNTIVIGAGEGATLGAMWMAAEYRRYRERMENVMPQIPPSLRSLEPDPEGKDLVCGIWLTISNSLDNKLQSNLGSWLSEVGGKQNKLPVPMLFLYGKDDPNRLNKQTTATVLQKMIPGYRMMEAAEGLNKDPNHKYTRDYAIDTKLEGSQLLQKSLNTSAIIKDYLGKVMDERGSVERKHHEPEKYRYFWYVSGARMPVIAKLAGEEFMLPIQPTMMGAR